MGEPSRRTNISTKEHWQSDHWVLGHVPDQGPSPPIAQFGWAASSRKSFGGFKLLPFNNDEGHFSWGPSIGTEMFWYPWHNPVPELYGQFLQPHGLGFTLTCTINWGTLYRCVPFQIMSNQLNLPQVDSNQSQGWSMEIRCTLSWMSSLIAKGLNTYVNKVFLVFIFNTFETTSQNLFFFVIMGYYVLIDEAKKYLNPF